MRNGSMNLNVLDEFVYLADTLSFKRTADHFFVSKSVISRHMAALEDEVGARLLERDSRGARLTEAGHEFYREAKNVLRDWDAAIERVRTVQGPYTQEARIGYLRNAARPVLVRFAHYMADHHPDVRLSLNCMEYADLRRALEEHAVDVALAVNVHPAQSRNYRSTPIYDDAFYVVCAAKHPLAQLTDGVSVSDLRDQKLLLPDSYVYGGMAEFIDELIDEKTLLVAQAYYQDIDMLYLKVQTEGYVAFSSGMNNLMFGDRLVELPIVGMNAAFSVSAFYHDDFVGGAYEACRDGFEWSARALKDWQPDISLQFFGQ